MNRRDTVLIVDDMEVNRVILRGLFQQEFNLLEAENGEQALMLLEQCHSSIAVILLDLVMPVMSGYQMLAEMADRALLTEVPVVVITTEGTAESEVRAFDMGASDIVMKPFEPHVVRSRVNNIVELNRHKQHLEELVKEQEDRLRQSNEVMIDALSSVIEYRSLESGQHTLRIRMFTKILLEDVAESYRDYGLNERSIGIISAAAAMHDIGKIAIPDAILNKPGALTPEEMEIMRTHTGKGCELLTELKEMEDEEYLRYAYHICRYHHERWDGGGYPDGLRGENIPICAQVVGIADVYDALTTDRVYKKAYPQEQAFNMILNGECGVFSPRLLECLKNVREQFAEMSRQYADGRSPKQDHFGPPDPADPRHAAQDTLQQGQTKYFTLLRHMDSAVMEMDLDNGVYHLVYAPNKDFELLRTGGSFEESIRNFVEGAVHPEDRACALDILTDKARAFFTEGVSKRTSVYRIYSQSAGVYRPCEASVLRLESGDPRQHRALLIWREQGGSAPIQPLEEKAGESGMMGVVQSCRNDRWFTLDHVGDGFCALVGYSREEIAARFQNRLISLIYPADREEVVRQTKAQLRAGNCVEVEYRLNHRAGRAVWVLEKSRLAQGENGDELLSCALMDVTQSKRAQEELRLTLERHKIIMDQTNDIIFEWDIERDTISYSSNWEKKFGYSPIREKAARKLLTVSHIYPDDLPGFTRLMRTMTSGEAYGQADVRVAQRDGRYLWCRIRATAQFDDSGRPVKAVGIMLDVDSEKRAAQALRDKAEQDGLTKLYNKSAGRRQVESLLEQRACPERAAMLIIDVDNFKLVNDRYGHMFGDAVLTEIAAEIRKLFRGGDVISRIGGDEFMVFLRHVPDAGLAADRARRIIAAFQGLFSQRMAECRLSCSIGVCLCPEDGTSFQDLFRRADRALYRAKELGKDRFVLYDRREMDRPVSADEGAGLAASTRIESDELQERVTDRLTQHAFRQLYESEDLEQAVSSILELVGRQFSLSRAYIFECTEDDTACRESFEWRADGVSPSLGTLHPLLLGQSDYADHFNETGIFYCPDVADLPDGQRQAMEGRNAQSVLQCAMREGGRFRGYVGFDDCGMRRMWTQEQIDAITFVSELLSVFLLKRRAQERAEEISRDMRMLLDSQSAWIYVIDPDTLRLLFINAKTRDLTPDARVGMRCHSAFMGRESRCENCPAQDILRRRSSEAEFYNGMLDVWSAVDASVIHWGGREACLLSCHDITMYKKRECGYAGGSAQPREENG